MNLLAVLAKISSMTMLSRVLGFIRDAIVARIFGAGAAMDAFVVAFRLPNLLRRIFAEGAFAQAFVPVLSEFKQNRTPENTRIFLQYVAGMLSFALVIVTAIGIIAAPIIISLTASGWNHTTDPNDNRFQLAVQLLRVVAPYILLISLSSFISSILNTYGKFSIPAFTPTLLNVSFIIFALFFVPYFDPPIMALGWAVVVGGILQLAFQLPWLIKLGFLRLPKLSFHNTAVNRVMKQMLPSIFASSAAQISLVINTIFASHLAQGSVSWMYYADRLMELPSGVIGAALGTILLPSLSKHAAAKNQQEFSALLDWGLRLCLLLILPAALGMAILGFPLVATLFMSSQFTAQDAHMTQYALMAYTIGLPAMMMVKILAPGFYAQKNVRTPMRIAIISLIGTQICNLIFVWQFKHVGLSLAIGLGACINASLLLMILRIRGIYQPRTGWNAFFFCVGSALLVMGLGLYVAQTFLPLQWIDVSGWHRILQLICLLLLAIILYFGTLIFLGMRPHHFKRAEQRQ